MVAWTHPEDVCQRGVGRDDVWGVERVGVEHMHGACRSSQQMVLVFGEYWLTDKVRCGVAHIAPELGVKLSVVLHKRSVPVIHMRACMHSLAAAGATR